MKLSAPTGVLCEAFGLKKAIDILAAAGYDAMDFSQTDEAVYTEKCDFDYYKEIRKYAEDKGLFFNQSHAPFASSYCDEEETAKRFDEITEAIKKASCLGIENIIVHPCQHLKYNVEGNPEILFDYNMKFYKRLIPYYEEYGVHIALENMWQRAGYITHSTCSTPEEFVRYLDGLDNECFVACLDIGHANLVREDIGEFAKKLGKYLKCLHVHDVDGSRDLHTIPYYGDCDWNKIMKALADCSYEGDLTFEADSFFDEIPKELFADSEIFMAKVGRQLISKFEYYKSLKK